MLDGQRDGRMDAAPIQEADGRLAAEHGRLEHLPPPLLRAAAAVLPVRVRPLQRDRLARRSWRSGPCAGSTSCRSCTGPGSTRCRSAARSASERSSASPRSATPGSTPASSTSRRSAGRARSGSRRGNATGSARGLTGADLPDHAYWEQWFPADWVSEMREQIRLWFYSQCFMAITLDGRQPYRRVLTYEKVSDENGREMHKSWGNAIEAERGARADGRGRDALALLRPDAEPAAALRLRDGRGGEEGAAHVLELGLVLHHVREHRRVRAVAASAPRRRGRSTAGCVARTRSSSATRPTRTSAAGRPT